MILLHSIAVFLLSAIVSASGWNDMYFRYIQPEDGLVNPSVMSICQDSYGRMWFGTEAGLSIYDGATLRSIRPSAVGDHGFHGASIKDIISDGSGSILFRADEELVRYNLRTSQMRVLSDSVSVLTEHDGAIYALKGANIFSYQSENDCLVPYSHIQQNGHVVEFLIDSRDNIWLASRDGLFMVDPNGISTKVLDDRSIYNIYESPSHDIWVCSRDLCLARIDRFGTVSYFNSSTKGAEKLLSNDARCVVEDRDGNIWLGTFKGLYKLSPSTGEFTPYVRDGSKGLLTQSSVYSLYIDKDNVLWTGTYYGGVSYAPVSGASIRYIGSSQDRGLTNPVVSSIEEGPDGNIWIGTEGGGLNLLDKASGRIIHLRGEKTPFLPATNVRDIAVSSDGKRMYVAATSAGVFEYNQAESSFEKIPCSDSVRRAYRYVKTMLSIGDKLFLSTRSGVYVHDFANSKDTLLVSAAGKDRYPMSVSADGSKLWIGGDGIVKYDATTLSRDLLVDDGGARVNALLAMADGRVAVALENHGITLVEEGKGQLIPFMDNPDADLNIINLAETKSGNIVACLYDGVCLLDKNAKVIRSYSSKGFFPISSILKDEGLYCSSDGSIYVGGINGILVFKEGDSAALCRNLYFSRLLLDERNVEPGDETAILPVSLPFVNSITLRDGNSRVRFGFASSDHVADFNISDYEYRLVPDDDKWHSVSGSLITYTNLSSGKHTLMVRDRYPGSHDCIPLALDVFVLWPWYLRWWAIMLWLLALGLLSHVIFSTVSKKNQAEHTLALNEAKFRFFTSMSHEFKTPLTLISGQVDSIMNTSKLPSPVYGKLVHVKKQVKEMSGIVSDLIEFRKYEQGHLEMRVSEVSLASILESAYDEFSLQAKAKDIDFKTDIQDGMECIYADRLKLQRLVANLVSNAVKYTPDGGSIVLRLEDRADAELLTVSDTGPGLSDEEKKHVFERFYRAGHSAENEGSGIGLALVKDIAQMHHAELVLDSTKGLGSTFGVSLLKGREHFLNDANVSFASTDETTQYVHQTHPVDTVLAPTEVEDGVDGEDTILIVEDNPELLAILSDMFSHLYNVVLAHDGREALEIVRKQMPSLVLSDVMMPRMSGTELCAAIKGDIGLCHIPVVLLTALDMPEQTLNGLLQGADDYIGKPFDSKILMARCNNIIRSRKALLKQFHVDNDSDIATLATNRLDKEFLDKFNAIVEENLGNFDLNNDLIAEKMNMSRASFYNKFRSLTQETPGDYISNRRLNKAAAMLAGNGGESISEIAETLGFNSSNYFSRKFKEKFGVSPAQYKQK